MQGRCICVLLLAAPLWSAGCVRGDRRAPLHVERDTVGDTVVVRTFVGSRWDADARLVPEMRIGAIEGEEGYLLGNVRGLAVAPNGAVYVYDAQVPALRKYGPEGELIATLGRSGGGPGEYRMSDGGLAVLADGRVVLRDPGNARFTLYDSAGGYLETWPFRDGVFVARPLYVDTAGSVYTQIWIPVPDGTRQAGLLQLASDGTRQDSILAPDWDFEEATLTFSTSEPLEVGGLPIATIVSPVPFTPRAHWTFSPFCWMIGGVSTEYAINVFHEDGSVLRIRRDAAPVPVAPAEREAALTAVLHNFRRAAPDWQWNGPPIPENKPPFKNVAAGRSGRIWVQLHQPGFLSEEADPSDPFSTDQWTEPVVWDVFESDGTYLGQVRAPVGTQTVPAPVFGAEHVWAVQVDDLGVQYVVRFRVVHGAG